MTNLKKIKLPKDVKHVLLIVYNVDETPYGTKMFKSNRWKIEYEKLYKALCNEGKPYIVSTYLIDEEKYNENGNVVVIDHFFSEKI